MAKANLIPKHYALTMHPHEVGDVIGSLRIHVRDWNAPESVVEFLSTLVNAYTGEIPEAPPKCTNESAHPFGSPLMVEVNPGDYYCVECKTHHKDAPSNYGTPLTFAPIMDEDAPDA